VAERGERGDKPGQGGAPGIESQTLQTATGEPHQVPGTPGGPNADGFDRSPEAEALRPEPGEGPGDPREGAGTIPRDPDATDPS
jgi:hypothetical protein